MKQFKVNQDNKHVLEIYLNNIEFIWYNKIHNYIFYLDDRIYKNIIIISYEIR